MGAWGVQKESIRRRPAGHSPQPQISAAPHAPQLQGAPPTRMHVHSNKVPARYRKPCCPSPPGLSEHLAFTPCPERGRERSGAGSEFAPQGHLVSQCPCPPPRHTHTHAHIITHYYTHIYTHTNTHNHILNACKSLHKYFIPETRCRQTSVRSNETLR